MGVRVRASAAGLLLWRGLVTADGSGEIHFDTQYHRGPVFETVFPGELQGRHHLGKQPVSVHAVAPGEVGEIRRGAPAGLALAQNAGTGCYDRTVVQALAQTENLRRIEPAFIVNLLKF